MTNTDVTRLLRELEKNESRSMAILNLIDGDCEISLIRSAVEELCDIAESMKLGLSIHEEPFCNEKINQA